MWTIASGIVQRMLTKPDRQLLPIRRRSTQVQKMLDCDVIARVEDQHAKAYSQVLLVNKPDGAKRFFIDFRALNMCISHMNWPLPVINQMLHCLGAHKPKYCAKFDMTKWYWQIALGV